MNNLNIVDMPQHIENMQGKIKALLEEDSACFMEAFNAYIERWILGYENLPADEQQAIRIMDAFVALNQNLAFIMKTVKAGQEGK